MLLAAVIRLQAVEIGQFRLPTGPSLRDFWFAHWQAVDERLAQELLQAQPVPFTLALLADWPPDQAACPIMVGQEIWLRVTSLSAALSAALLEKWLPALPSRISLGGVCWQVTGQYTTGAEHPWAGQSSLDDLVAQRLTNPHPPARWRLRFGTPLVPGAAEEGAHQLTPPQLAAGWVKHWNTWAPVPLPAGLLEAVQESVLAQSTGLRTVNVPATGSAGYTGVVDLVAADLPLNIQAALDALIGLAFFCGSGVQTELGLGATRVKTAAAVRGRAARAWSWWRGGHAPVASPQLFSTVLTLFPAESGCTLDPAKNDIQDWFRTQIERYDAPLMRRLFADSDLRPYTLSGLMMPPWRTALAGRPLPPDRPVYLRITALTTELSECLRERVLPNLPERLVVQQLPLCLQPPAAHRWEGQASCASLVEHAAQSRARQVAVDFASPTVFHSQGSNICLPIPAHILQSWWRKWNAFAPEAWQIDAAWPQFVEACVRVSQLRQMSTRRWLLAEKTHSAVTGFEGQVELALLPLARCQAWATQWPGADQVLRVLSVFSLYCGTGRHTTQGMGQTGPAAHTVRKPGTVEVDSAGGR